MLPDAEKGSLVNAWSLSLVGAVVGLTLLCTVWPDPYLEILRFLPGGLVVTFEVTVLSIICAIPLGLLTGLGRLSHNRIINLVASTYVEVIRGIPLLVQIFYIYYALAKFLQVSGLTSAVIAISFCYGAYMGEVFRAGCCYRRGYGKIFYFQPGHESYPTYHKPEIIRVIKNAVHWTYSDYRRVIDCPQVSKISG